MIDEVSDPTYAHDFFARPPIRSNIFLRFFPPLFKKINPENTPQLSIIHILTFLKGQLICRFVIRRSRSLTTDSRYCLGWLFLTYCNYQIEDFVFYFNLAFHLVLAQKDTVAFQSEELRCALRCRAVQQRARNFPPTSIY